MSAHNSAYRSGACYRSAVVTIGHLSRTPVLTRNAAYIARCALNIARVIAAADDRRSAHVSDNARNGAAAAYRSIVSAVFNLSSV